MFNNLTANLGDDSKKSDLDYESAANIFPNPSANTFTNSSNADDFENF